MCLLFSPLLLRSMYRSSTYRYPTSVPWPRDWDAERLECSNKWVAVDVSTDKLDAVLQALLVWLAQIPLCPAQLSTSQFNSGLLRVLLLGRANVHPIGCSCSCFLIWGWCAQKGISGQILVHLGVEGLFQSFGDHLHSPLSALGILGNCSRSCVYLRTVLNNSILMEISPSVCFFPFFLPKLGNSFAPRFKSK